MINPTYAACESAYAIENRRGSAARSCDREGRRDPHLARPGASGALRYALTYGTPDESAVSYADPDGSGGMRRIRDREVPYPIVSVARLMADFERNVRREIEHERSDPARG